VLGSTYPRNGAMRPSGLERPPGKPRTRPSLDGPACSVARLRRPCRIAVIVEGAHRARMALLLMGAYGLIEREQEVTTPRANCADGDAITTKERA
jgi:hypothetical protein